MAKQHLAREDCGFGVYYNQEGYNGVCLKETRGYWKLKGEALDCAVGRTRFGRDCGPVIRLLYDVTNQNGVNLAELLRHRCSTSIKVKERAQNMLRYHKT